MAPRSTSSTPRPAEALAVARDAAGGLDVRLGGGPTVVRDFVAAGLVDHLHLVQVPIVLGRGVRVWDGLEALEEHLRHRGGLVAERRHPPDLHPADGRGRVVVSELVVDFITSLDGYAAADGWPGWWGLEGPEYLAWLGEAPERDHTALLGATTYRLMSGFAAGGEDGTDALTAMDKVVFSSTLTEPLTWANTRLVTGDAVAAVRSMKDAGTPMRTIGSLSLCRSLLTAGLVDRFRVVVFPVITGATGRERVYDGYPDVALELRESRTFDGRIQLLDYRPTVLDGPPLGADGGSGTSA